MKFLVKVIATESLETEITIDAPNEEKAAELAIQLAMNGRGVEWQVNDVDDYEVVDILEVV